VASTTARRSSDWVPRHLVELPVVRVGKQMAEKLKTTVSYWTEYVMYE
jgi:hypothetical protein